MTASRLSTLAAAAGTALWLAFAASAWAQAAPDSGSERLDTLGRDTKGLFQRMFGGSDRARDEAPVTLAQTSPSEIMMRLDRIENQLRQITGAVEQLQYRNQQLEGQVRGLTEAGAGAPPPAPARSPQARPPAPGHPAPGAPGAIPRRSDAFDPDQHPNAPGAPHTLGAVPAPLGAPPPVIQAPPGAPMVAEPAAPPRVGAPGGRMAGAPLDLSTLSAQAANDPTLAPPGPAPAAPAGPPPRLPPGVGAPPPQQQMVMGPTGTPRDEYDLAYGYVLRKDYALAEDAFRGFLKKHPSDRLTPDAHYWLGETLFQRQRYRDAAESFLTVSTKYETAGKAPEALLRLGQSLAALNEKEAACATLGEINRKYPRASVNVKQGVEREQKRARC